MTAHFKNSEKCDSGKIWDSVQTILGQFETVQNLTVKTLLQEFDALEVYVHPKTAFTWCQHILKTVKNVTVAKYELAFTRCRNKLKAVRNLTVKNSLQDFDAKEMT